MRKTLVLAMACAAAAPAVAADAETPPRAPIVRDGDVRLAFDWLREALRSAFEGREAPPPAELEKRGGEIADALKRRGVELGREWLDEAERGAREALRELQRPESKGPNGSAARPLPGQQAI